MKLRDDVRPGQFMPDVVMPDDLAVRRVEERNSIATIVEGTLCDAFAIPFGLRQHTLRAKG